MKTALQHKMLSNQMSSDLDFFIRLVVSSTVTNNISRWEPYEINKSKKIILFS